jgi:deoxyribonuclease V
MKACVDVDYRGEGALAAVVGFRDWADASSAFEATEPIATVAEYQPGQFYKRELPCLLAVLARLPQPPELVIVDGYVWLGGEERPGLGGHLFDALGKRVPVIGVAKSKFLSARLALPALRGESATKPLFVTAAGMDVMDAVKAVRAMHGHNRLPTLLKRVDSLCRQG